MCACLPGQRDAEKPWDRSPGCSCPHTAAQESQDSLWAGLPLLPETPDAPSPAGQATLSSAGTGLPGLALPTQTKGASGLSAFPYEEVCTCRWSRIMIALISFGMK